MASSWRLEYGSSSKPEKVDRKGKKYERETYERETYDVIKPDKKGKKPEGTSKTDFYGKLSEPQKDMIRQRGSAALETRAAARIARTERELAGAGKAKKNTSETRETFEEFEARFSLAQRRNITGAGNTARQARWRDSGYGENPNNRR